MVNTETIDIVTVKALQRRLRERIGIKKEDEKPTISEFLLHENPGFRELLVRSIETLIEEFNATRVTDENNKFFKATPLLKQKILSLPSLRLIAGDTGRRWVHCLRQGIISLNDKMKTSEEVWERELETARAENREPKNMLELELEWNKNPGNSKALFYGLSGAPLEGMSVALALHAYEETVLSSRDVAKDYTYEQDEILDIFMEMLLVNHYEEKKEDPLYVLFKILKDLEWFDGYERLSEEARKRAGCR